MGLILLGPKWTFHVLRRYDRRNGKDEIKYIISTLNFKLKVLNTSPHPEISIGYYPTSSRSKIFGSHNSGTVAVGNK